MFLTCLPIFPLIDVVLAVGNLPGASRFKTQMVDPCDVVRVTVGVTQEVSQCSRGQLGLPMVTLYS